MITHAPRSIIAALLVALGLVGAGWFAAQGMAKLRTADRYVTVKGSAEKIVDADLVVWPLPHMVGGNDLAAVQRQLTANTEAIRKFFLAAGFSADEIAVSPGKLEDRWTYSYGENRPPDRYLYSTTVTLRTTKVAQAIGALRSSGDLLEQGVMLGGSGGDDNAGSGPEFDYTKLNDVKPALIAEATANARKSAEQFAKDSGAHIGGIRTANQGQIDINNRDQGSPQVKKVRVVTTVEYFLKD